MKKFGLSKTFADSMFDTTVAETTGKGADALFVNNNEVRANAKVGLGVDALFANNNEVRTNAKLGLGVDALFANNNEVRTNAKLGLGVDALFVNNTAPATDEKDNRIAELEKENAELRAQLKRAYDIDQSNANQELITLKNDIVSGLKFEYDAFSESIACECNTENFIAYRGTITRVFRTLKRLGLQIA